jgi:hypothetical protein
MALLRLRLLRFHADCWAKGRLNAGNDSLSTVSDVTRGTSASYGGYVRRLAKKVNARLADIEAV